MFGIDFAPGLIMGLREGLEAFLIVAIMLQYLNKINRPEYKKNVYYGLIAGIGASVVFGLLLFGIAGWIGANSDNLAKLWEFVASFAALGLITTFIVFMIRHSDQITNQITDKMALNLSANGILLLAFVMVVREGAEVALFSFASTNETSYISGALFGIAIAGVLTFLIHQSLIKVNLKLLFQITLIYLILQAGFMLGYGTHEFFSYLKAEAILDAANPLYVKMFNLSGTILDHQSGILGIPLYITIGWYSRPEILQFVVQYLYTAGLLFYFIKSKRKTKTAD